GVIGIGQGHRAGDGQVGCQATRGGHGEVAYEGGLHTEARIGSLRKTAHHAVWRGDYPAAIGADLYTSFRVPLEKVTIQARSSFPFTEKVNPLGPQSEQPAESQTLQCRMYGKGGIGLM